MTHLRKRGQPLGSIRHQTLSFNSFHLDPVTHIHIVLGIWCLCYQWWTDDDILGQFDPDWPKWQLLYSGKMPNKQPLMGYHGPTMECGYLEDGDCARIGIWESQRFWNPEAGDVWRLVLSELQRDWVGSLSSNLPLPETNGVCTQILILLTFDIDCPWWQLMPSGKLPHSLWWPSGEEKPPVSQIGGEMIIWRFSPLLIKRSADRDNLALSVASSLQTGELRSSLPAAAGKRECQEFYVKFCRMHLMIGYEEKLYH